jgi:5-methylcytosine-specific restriction endonuclease McrA
MKQCAICCADHDGAGQTCSRSCRSKLAALRSGKSLLRTTCEVCGADYKPTYNKQRTCGRLCGRQLPEYKQAVRENAARAAARKQVWPASRVRFASCQECGEMFAYRRGEQIYCSAVCRKGGARRRARVNWRSGYKDSDAARRLRQKARDDRKSAWLPYECEGCGVTAVGFRGRLYCSRACARTVIRRKTRGSGGKSYHRKRARKYGVKYEPGITLAKLIDRDHGVCGLCGEPVTAKWPDIMCASIDHVVPMSAGGPHAWANVQLAHFLCNSYKGASEDVDFRLEAADGATPAASGSQAA